SFAIGNLVREFLSRSEGGVASIVDIGCGDGALIEALVRPGALFFGVDRSLSRIRLPATDHWQPVTSIDDVPRDGCHLIFSNELFDALPFARLVQRGEHVHELWVTDELEWTEREAP